MSASGSVSYATAARSPSSSVTGATSPSGTTSNTGSARSSTSPAPAPVKAAGSTGKNQKDGNTKNEKKSKNSSEKEKKENNDDDKEKENEKSAAAAAAAEKAKKISLTPAPVPSVNVWKLRQKSIQTVGSDEGTVDDSSLNNEDGDATSVTSPTTSTSSVAHSNGELNGASTGVSVNPTNKQGKSLDPSNWPKPDESSNVIGGSTTIAPATSSSSIPTIASSAAAAASTKVNRSAGGKEKWVPYTPVLNPSPPLSSGSKPKANKSRSKHHNHGNNSNNTNTNNNNNNNNHQHQSHNHHHHHHHQSNNHVDGGVNGSVEKTGNGGSTANALDSAAVDPTAASITTPLTATATAPAPAAAPTSPPTPATPTPASNSSSRGNSNTSSPAIPTATIATTTAKKSQPQRRNGSSEKPLNSYAKKGASPTPSTGPSSGSKQVPNGVHNGHHQQQHSNPHQNTRNFQPSFIPNGRRQSHFNKNYFVQPDYMYGQQVFPSHAPASQYDVALGLIIAQIEYYLSVENLCKDIYLRRQMNSLGLVPLSVLASFNRVKSLTNGDFNLFLEASRWAPSAQVIGDRIRPRIGWETWVLPVADRLPSGYDEVNNSVVLTEEEQAPKFNAAAAVPFIPKSKSGSISAPAPATTTASPPNESLSS